MASSRSTRGLVGLGRDFGLSRDFGISKKSYTIKISSESIKVIIATDSSDL